MAAAAPIIGAIGGAFSGKGASRPRTTTQSFNQSSTSTAQLDRKQRKVNKNLFRQILDALKLGPNVAQHERNLARGQINATSKAGQDALEANLTARGYGDSGKMAGAFRSNELERARNTQNAEAVLRQQATQRFWQGIVPAAFQFNTPRTTTTESSGTSTGSQSGVPWQSSVGGGLGDLASFMFMRNLTGGGGGGSYYGGSPLPNLGAAIGNSQIPFPCMLAQELYGDWRVPLVQAWLLRQAAVSLRWRVIVIAYSLTGRRLVSFVRRSVHVRRWFRGLFDRAVQKALTV